MADITAALHVGKLSPAIQAFSDWIVSPEARFLAVFSSRDILRFTYTKKNLKQTSQSIE
ncbi:MAG: hypothetical protein HUJ18_13060 [Marinobacter sp.]|nr:hypothetical protein [Marinobacter sp.]